MATYVQRAQAIGDALVNGIATPTQINRLGLALAQHGGMVTEYNTLTQLQKAEFFVTRMRALTIGLVKHYDEFTAAANAINAATAAVDLEFKDTI